MKTLILAALTVMSIGAGVANAQTYSHANHQGSNSAAYSWTHGGGGGGD